MEKRELIAIAESPIFHGIEITELNRLLTSHNPLIKHYEKNETVWLQDSALDRLIIVISGRLKAKMVSAEGKIINMEEFTNYQPVAIPVLFSKDQRLPVTLYATEDSELFLLPKEILLKCCMANQIILENTMLVMSGKVDYLSRKINFLQLNTIKQKISEILTNLSNNAGSTTFKMELTKEELSKDMGVTRPSLSREFSLLIQDGIISQKKDIITILDPIRLKNYK